MLSPFVLAYFYLCTFAEAPDTRRATFSHGRIPSNSKHGQIMQIFGWKEQLWPDSAVFIAWRDHPQPEFLLKLAVHRSQAPLSAIRMLDCLFGFFLGTGRDALPQLLS